MAPLYLVGLLAVIVRPDHPSARWLGAAGSLIAIETVARRLLPQLGDLGAGWWVASATFLQVAILATAASVASVLVVFPDDHYRYPYQKRVLLAIWLLVAVVPATLLVSRPSLHFFPSWAGPDVVNPAFVAILASLAVLRRSPTTGGSCCGRWARRRWWSAIVAHRPGPGGSSGGRWLLP
jgi:hypothetical protein